MMESSFTIPKDLESGLLQIKGIDYSFKTGSYLKLNL